MFDRLIASDGDSPLPTHVNDFRELNGDVVDLGYGAPFGVNDLGEVGFSKQSQTSLESEVFLWNSRQGLRRLGGFPEHSQVGPSALNNRREIVGAIHHEGSRAIRWTPRQGMQTLDVSGEVPFSNAASINRWGAIVGYGPNEYDDVRAPPRRHGSGNARPLVPAGSHEHVPAKAANSRRETFSPLSSSQRHACDSL